MNLLHVFLVAALCVQINAVRHDRTFTGSDLQMRMARKLNSTIRQDGGCNISVCFAIDGSLSRSNADFIFQVEFVSFLLAIKFGQVDEEFAIVQYGREVLPITALSTDIENGLLAVNSATQERGGDTFVFGALSYCMSELINRRGQAPKIVLFGDGSGNVGGREAVRLANLFRSTLGGKISAVATGFASERQLLRLVGGDPRQVFALDSLFEVKDAIEEFVEDMCSA